LTHGLKAKTNFTYSKSQILDIINKGDDDLANDEDIIGDSIDEAKEE
jgi:hypothetical protein